MSYSTKRPNVLPEVVPGHPDYREKPPIVYDLKQDGSDDLTKELVTSRRWEKELDLSTIIEEVIKSGDHAKLGIIMLALFHRNSKHS